MRSYSVLLRHEPSSGNDRTTLGVFTKSSFSRFLSTPGSCWGSLRLPYLRLPYLQQVWLHSLNLLQVWLVLPHLLQVWLTQDQLGAFPAALPVALSATLPGILPSAPSAALYLPHKTRTYKVLCVARKTAVFPAPKPLLLAPTRSPRVDYTCAHAQNSAI